MNYMQVGKNNLQLYFNLNYILYYSVYLDNLELFLFS